ncbi:MAG: EAL domain-containing protein [Candidatus Obscuribacterales bacterium]|nr:EAL domain-containing protein [Candidatus Obscuribacterales bacterium]
MSEEKSTVNIQALLNHSEKFLRSARMPIFEIDSGRICGFEMLIRGPGKFKNPEILFEEASEEGCLVAVDLASLHASIAAAQDIEPSQRVHVNLFAETILSTDLLSIFNEALGKEKLRSGQFCIEIIEMPNMPRPEDLLLRVQELQKSGLEFAIDDVGWGQSAVEFLVILEPELIKIDRRFVTGAHLNKELSRRYRRLVSIAKSLNCRIVAEGVDTEADRILAQDLAVHMGQGLLTGPLPD